MTLFELLNDQTRSDKTAVVFKDRAVSYKELSEYSRDYAGVLKDLSIDRRNIAVLLPNSPEYIFAYLGVYLSGNVIAPVNYNSSINEIINTINTFDIALLVTDERTSAEIKTREALLTHKVSVMDACSKQRELIAGEKPDCPVTKTPKDVVIMLGTSGSTSNPKRVMLTEQQLLDNAHAIIGSLGFNNDDVFLVISSFSFSAANTAQLIAPLLLSAKIVLFDSVVHPGKIVRCIKNHGITTTAIVPSLLHIWANYDFDPEDTKTLRMLCLSGSIPAHDDIVALNAKLPYTEISNNYGMTEAAPRISCQRHANEYPMSVGKPLKNVAIRIVDEFGNEAERGKVGQIAVSSPSLMSGYYANPDETARTIRNGWLVTGDAGYINGDGNLIINGRIKNIIISNGMNIYPEEIEEVINKNPHVAESMVKGTESDIYGEVPVAFVVSDGSITEWELIEYCRRFLQELKVPRQIFFVDKLDKTGSGKIRRIQE